MHIAASDIDSVDVRRSSRGGGFRFMGLARVLLHTQAEEYGAGHERCRNEEWELGKAVKRKARQHRKEHPCAAAERLLNTHVESALITRSDTREKCCHARERERSSQWKERNSEPKR